MDYQQVALSQFGVGSSGGVLAPNLPLTRQKDLGGIVSISETCESPTVLSDDNQIFVSQLHFRQQMGVSTSYGRFLGVHQGLKGVWTRCRARCSIERIRNRQMVSESHLEPHTGSSRCTCNRHQSYMLIIAKLSHSGLGVKKN